MKNATEDKLIAAIDSGKVAELGPQTNASAVEAIGQVEDEAKGRGISHLKETLVPHRQSAEYTIAGLLEKVKAYRASGGPLLGTLIRAIAEWLVQFKPSNKEISTLIMDSEEGRAKVLITPEKEAVVYQVASRQHANRYKFLARVEAALSNPTFWAKADRKEKVKDGLKAGDMIYMNPSAMLDAGYGITTVTNTWMNALRPSISDVGAETHVSDEANARRYAKKALVAVRRKAKDGRERKARRPVFENKNILFGFLDGLLSHAATVKFTDGEQAIVFTGNQADALLERLTALCPGTPTTPAEPVEQA